MPATKICKFKSFRAKSSEATNQQLHNWQAGVISLSVAMIFDYCVRIYIRLYIDDYHSGHHENRKRGVQKCIWENRYRHFCPSGTIKSFPFPVPLCLILFGNFLFSSSNFEHNITQIVGNLHKKAERNAQNIIGSRKLYVKTFYSPSYYKKCWRMQLICKKLQLFIIILVIIKMLEFT